MRLEGRVELQLVHLVMVVVRMGCLHEEDLSSDGRTAEQGRLCPRSRWEHERLQVSVAGLDFVGTVQTGMDCS